MIRLRMTVQPTNLVGRLFSTPQSTPGWGIGLMWAS
jgi:hypothetical protein